MAKGISFPCSLSIPCIHLQGVSKDQDLNFDSRSLFGPAQFCFEPTEYFIIYNLAQVCSESNAIINCKLNSKNWKAVMKLLVIHAISCPDL